VSGGRLHVSDGGEEFEVQLADERIVFGRLPECGVVLEDAGVSREHAALEPEGGGWAIVDLGSRNGTFVNDQPVERRRVRPGDRIRIGPGVTVELLGGVGATRAESPARASAGRARAPRDDADDAEDADGGDDEPVRAARPARAGGGSWLLETRWRLTPRSSAGSPVTLSALVTTVGRDPGAGLTLDDESVSRMHARLDLEGGALHVTDLKSRNGTSVNGEDVMRSPVHPGDALRFGDVEFRVSRAVSPAWRRLGAIAAGAALLATLAVVTYQLSDAINERASVERTAARVRAGALEATREGIDAAREGDADLARGHLLYAADLLLLSGIAPPGASLQQPGRVFGAIVRELPEHDREFDFTHALDPATVEASQARLATLTNREYIEHQVKRFSVELGQDAGVPRGFLDQVTGFVEQYQKYPAGMQAMIRRSHDLQPRIRDILAQRHLPEAFCYVAWVESGLDPRQRSPVGALGMWQFMPVTAREYKLRVDPGNPARDERTNIERSTAAAADYFATLLRDQGPEYFMLVLASYNRGHNALDRAKQKITDPMLRSTRKYWYLVENRLLPEETRNYVPKIFAVRVVAEAPERFGFQP
jgi:pSer/pThr/pTyr-binding forkhead associated (FHA) protein